MVRVIWRREPLELKPNVAVLFCSPSKNLYARSLFFLFFTASLSRECPAEGAAIETEPSDLSLSQIVWYLERVVLDMRVFHYGLKQVKILERIGAPCRNRTHNKRVEISSYIHLTNDAERALQSF